MTEPLYNTNDSACNNRLLKEMFENKISTVSDQSAFLLPHLRMSLNYDEREILERLLRTPDNSADFCVKDFSFGRDRFIRALDKLLRKEFIDSLLYSLDPISGRNSEIGFSFNDHIADDMTHIELIKTDEGAQYIKDHPQ